MQKHSRDWLNLPFQNVRKATSMIIIGKAVVLLTFLKVELAYLGSFSISRTFLHHACMTVWYNKLQGEDGIDLCNL